MALLLCVWNRNYLGIRCEIGLCLSLMLLTALHLFSILLIPFTVMVRGGTCVCVSVWVWVGGGGWSDKHLLLRAGLCSLWTSFCNPKICILKILICLYVSVIMTVMFFFWQLFQDVTKFLLNISWDRQKIAYPMNRIRYGQWMDSNPKILYYRSVCDLGCFLHQSFFSCE